MYYKVAVITLGKKMQPETQKCNPESCKSRGTRNRSSSCKSRDGLAAFSGLSYLLIGSGRRHQKAAPGEIFSFFAKQDKIRK
jgi:hypothetical protein